jgi:hypothetical protein
VLLIVVVLLLVHLLYMGTGHADETSCATCLTVLVTGAIVFASAARTPGRAPLSLSFQSLNLLTVAAGTSGRHPPSRGAVLRL